MLGPRVCGQVVDGRPVNTATGTRPCVVHANGWDKQPLLTLLERCGLLEDDGLLDAVQARRETLEKTRTLQTREQVGASDMRTASSHDADLTRMHPGCQSLWA